MHIYNFLLRCLFGLRGGSSRSRKISHRMRGSTLKKFFEHSGLRGKVRNPQIYDTVDLQSRTLQNELPGFF